MTEKSWFWSGISAGDCGPYTASQWAEFQKTLFQNDPTKDGVILGNPFELIVQFVAGSTFRVYPGCALVDGIFYESDANIDFVLNFTPGFYYRIVLRKDSLAQTVRVVIKGPSLSIPTLSLPPAEDFIEISLAWISIAPGPGYHIEDDREFISFTSTAENHQGSSGLDYTWEGTTDYFPILNKHEFGSVEVTFPAGPSQISDEITVTFPRRFEFPPLMKVSCFRKAAGELCFATLTDIGFTTFSVKCWCPTATLQSCTVYWWAVGMPYH